MAQHLNSSGGNGAIGKTNGLHFRKVDDEWAPDQQFQSDPGHVAVDVMDLRPSRNPSVLMTAHSSLSLASLPDHLSIGSDIASVTLYTGENDASDRPAHWDLAAVVRRFSMASVESTENESRTNQGDAKGPKKKRVARVVLGIAAFLVLAAVMIFYLLTESRFLFGDNGILGELTRSSVPEVDRTSRSIAIINSDQQLIGKDLNRNTRLGRGDIKIYWKGIG